MKRQDCLYTTFYCEENIWHLNQRLGPAGNQVIFISNAVREVLMFRQRGFREGAVWDYHVILAAAGMVYDLDSTLAFPCPLADYLDRSFLPALSRDLEPFFRVIPGPVYAAEFASDRSHMQSPAGGYLQPVPAWPPIHPEAGNRVLEFADMQRPSPGRVVSLNELPTALGQA